MIGKPFRVLALYLGAGLLFTSSFANAATVAVNYVAHLTPIDPAVVNVGPGTLSGTLGTFDVNAVGDQFELPFDGSLLATVSGFNAGFPNGDFAFDTAFSGGGEPRPPIIEFLSIGPTVNDYSVGFVQTGNNTGLISNIGSCTVSGIDGQCRIAMFNFNGSGTSGFAGADFLLSPFDSAQGELSFTFELHGEPAVVPLPATLPMLITGLAGLFGIRAANHRRRHSKMRQNFN